LGGSVELQAASKPSRLMTASERSDMNSSSRKQNR